MNKSILPINDVLLENLADGISHHLDLVSDKWTVLVMIQLCGSPKRFNEIQRHIKGVSQKSLAQTLRKLERNGLITRQVHASSPPAVEYGGTELGFSLKPLMQMIFEWSVGHSTDVQQARLAYDAGASTSS